MIDKNNERMIYDFLNENLENYLGKLKPFDHYKTIVENTIQVKTVSEFN